MAVQLCTARARLSRCALFAGRRLAHTTGREVRVFRDLRRQGFYITSAGKFGGDYLVYPGDPLRFHARFMAVCVSMDDLMPLCDVLAIARLGSNVKRQSCCVQQGKARTMTGRRWCTRHYSGVEWCSTTVGDYRWKQYGNISSSQRLHVTTVLWNVVGSTTVGHHIWQYLSPSQKL